MSDGDGPFVTCGHTNIATLFQTSEAAEAPAVFTYSEGYGLRSAAGTLGHQRIVPVIVNMMEPHVRGGLLFVGQTMRSCVRNSALAVAMLLAISRGERHEVLYPDRAAAQQAGAIDRGWVPVWVPKSARAIHEIHDLDTNRSMMSFSFDAGEPLNLGSACTQVQRDALRPVPFAKTWWPNDVPPSQSVSHRHVYYACQDGAYAAVSQREGEAYYWRP